MLNYETPKLTCDSTFHLCSLNPFHMPVHNEGKDGYYYLLKAFNRTGSPQGFSLNQILQKLNIITIQNMHILQT